MTFCHPVDAISNRHDISLTLVLVVAAYKVALSSMLPQITYLTLLDQYCVGCGCLILLTALENAILGSFAVRGRLSIETAETIDWGFFGLLVLLWLLLHAWYFVAARRSVTRGPNVRPVDRAKSKDRQKEEPTAKPPKHSGVQLEA